MCKTSPSSSIQACPKCCNNPDAMKSTTECKTCIETYCTPSSKKCWPKEYSDSPSSEYDKSICPMCYYPNNKSTLTQQGCDNCQKKCLNNICIPDTVTIDKNGENYYYRR